MAHWPNKYLVAVGQTNKQQANNIPEWSPLRVAPVAIFAMLLDRPPRVPTCTVSICAWDHVPLHLSSGDGPCAACRLFSPQNAASLHTRASHSHMTDGLRLCELAVYSPCSLRVLIVCGRKWAELAFVHLVGGRPCNGLLALILICRWCCSWCLSCGGHPALGNLRKLSISWKHFYTWQTFVDHNLFLEINRLNWKAKYFYSLTVSAPFIIMSLWFVEILLTGTNDFLFVQFYEINTYPQEFV